MKGERGDTCGGPIQGLVTWELPLQLNPVIEMDLQVALQS